MRGDDNSQNVGPVDQELMRGRTLFCAVIALLLFLFLALRLWQVQVLTGHELQERARRQAIRPVRLNPVRGRIFDAEGRALVDNQDRYDLVFYVSEMRQPGRQEKTIDHVLTVERMLASYLGRRSQLNRETVLRQLTRRPVLPLTVFEGLSEIELAAFAEFLPRQAGVEILPYAERLHHYPGLLSQVLGYTGRNQPDGSDVLEDLPRLYAMPEQRGRSGLERVFDTELAGQPGAKLLLVDSIGYARQTVGAGRQPEDGQDLHLTIDITAQSLAEELLHGHAGAIVVTEVNTGAIVVMASAPTFDLNSLNRGNLTHLIRDEVNRPMLNRATQGTYTPGSIVKPLVALAALQEIPDFAAEYYECSGRYKIGDTAIRCAQRYGHGLEDLSRAITVSCNPFFIHLGLKLGIDQYTEYLQEAGFGEKTGIEIGDAAGICPERAIASKLWNRNWIAIDTAYVSMGQGAFTVTPLQASVYAAALANGGVVYRPYLVSKITTQDGRILQETAPSIRHRLTIARENWEVVRNAMVQTVESREGSASGLRKAGIPVAAKTGTAEVGQGEDRHKNTWVIAFFPADHPQYALSCLIERGDSGGKTAVPIAAEFIRRWLVAE